MTPEELAVIKERLAKATPGPWKYYRKDDFPLRADDGKDYKNLGTKIISQDYPNNDAIILEDADGEFIANAPTDIANLIAALEALQQEVK